MYICPVSLMLKISNCFNILSATTSKGTLIFSGLSALSVLGLPLTLSIFSLPDSILLTLHHSMILLYAFVGSFQPSIMSFFSQNLFSSARCFIAKVGIGSSFGRCPLSLAYFQICLLYTSPSPRDGLLSRM